MRSAKMIIVAPPLTSDRFLRPLVFLRSEHDRQLMICDWLIALAGNMQIGLVIEEVEELIAFFTEDLPLHSDDEEKDLFPILSRCSLPEDRIEPVLGQFKFEHNVDRFLALHVVIDLKAIAVKRTLKHPNNLWADMRAFAEAQRRHIYWENRTVLSLGLKRLGPKDEEVLGRKMAERRGLILPH